MNPSEPSPQAPVAIIGMSCLFPRAEGLARFWSNVRKGADAIAEVPPSHWSPADYFDGDPRAADRTYARRGGFLAPVDFPPMDFGIAPHAIEATDTTQLLGLMVARAALEDAGLGSGGRPFDRDRVSVVLGVTGALELVIPLGARLGHPIWRQALKGAGVDPRTSEEVVRRISDSYVGWQESSFPGLLGNVAAGRIANRLDLRGTNCVVDAACASSLGAVNLALLELAAGRCDLAVTGGLDTFNDIFMYMCFSKTPALSPSGEARPFDAEADGTVLGEGLGVLVLKRLDDARRDGDRVYAVIRAMGTSSDGQGQAVYAPSAAGQARALRRAYALAGASPGSVELVEAHGTGTRVGDRAELEALETVYGAARPGAGWCALGSVKSQIGHAKAAAGAAGLIKAALALHHKVLPPSIKVRRPIESLADGSSPFYLNTEARPWLPPGSGGPRRAAVSAFGFGGSNYHCLLEEAEPETCDVDWDGDVQIVAFSADAPDEIEQALARFEAAGLDDWNIVRAEAARGRAEFRAEHAHRLVLVVERDRANWPEVMAEARARLRDDFQTAGGAANGHPVDRTVPPTPTRGAAASIHVGAGPRPGALALVFPGQGSQFPGMSRELACVFPAMREALALMDVACAREGPAGPAPARLSERIYPPAAFDDAARQARAEALRDTRFAQPAIGAVSLGQLRILESFDVRPDLVGGHSFGELTALCAAGRIDDGAFARLARRRADLMAEQAEDGTGAMLAVLAPADEVAALVREHGWCLVIANVNAPRQCVLSGPSPEIERARAALTEHRIAVRRLPVSAAFHGPMVARAEPFFRAALGEERFARGTVPVFANTSAAPYPDNPDQARDLLAGQLARPVEFAAQIEAMYQSGARVFLEVGPGATLTGLVHAVLVGKDHQALAVDASRGPERNLVDLARALAALAAVGYAVDLDRWDDGGPRQGRTTRKSAHTVRISGANVRPRPAHRPAEGENTRPPKADDRNHANGREGANGRETAAGLDRPAILLAPKPPDFLRHADKVGPAPAPALSLELDTPTRNHAENHQPMNLPDWAQSPQPSHQNGNGQPAVRALGPLRSAVDGPLAGPSSPPPSSGPAPQRPGPQAFVSSAPATTTFETLQANLVALQRLAAQTAEAHRQFLEGQELAQRGFLALLDRQQSIGGGANKNAFAPTATIAEAPATFFEAEAPAPAAPTRPASGPAPATAPESLSQKWEGEAPAEPLVPWGQARQEPRPPGKSTSGTDAEPATGHLEAAAALIAVVSEKTGYPADALELDMRLDADLGIDSIKRVEILSALQEQHPSLPALRPEQLGAFPTLGAIAEFLGAGAEPAPKADAAPSSRGAASIATAAASTVPATTPADGRLARALIETVADKTGYPPEMLELDMRLDADLGIDSIKRVEILSALQEQFPALPSLGPDRVGAFSTLREIVSALGHAPEADGHKNGDGAPAGISRHAGRSGQESSASPRAINAEALAQALIETVADKTGYPPEMLELDMRLDADLGIDSIKRVEILSALQERFPETRSIGPEHTGRLQTLGQIVEFLAPASNAVVLAAELVEQAETARTNANVKAGPNHFGSNGDGPAGTRSALAGPGADAKRDAAPRRLAPRVVPLDRPDRRAAVGLAPGGAVWIADDGSPLAEAVRAQLQGRGFRARIVALKSVPATTADDRLCGLVLLAPNGPTEGTFVADAFRAVRAFGGALERRAGRPGSAAALLTVARLDGAFGFSGRLGDRASIDSGALAGLSKTVDREWPEVSCKAVDLDPECLDNARVAAWIAEELLSIGPAEVGLTNDGRVAIELAPAPPLGPEIDGDRPAALPPSRGVRRGELVVVTGGARGVTAEVAVALARAFGPRLLLLGRTPGPEAGPGGEPEALRDCRDEAAVQRALMALAGPPLSPREAREQARAVLARRELKHNLERIAEAGSPVDYRSVDVRDAAAVRAAIAQARTTYGPVRGLVHGAGVLADRRALDQTDAQFDLVYGTKVQGLENLFAAIGPDELAFVGIFSSSTARFGRVGQIAYAAANEWLNKWAQRARARMPRCRTVAWNWGPWAGGMVTNELRPMFEKEGIALVPLEAGARLAMADLAAPPDAGHPIEVVVLAGAEAAIETMNVNHANAGANAHGNAAANIGVEIQGPARPQSRARSEGPLGLAFRREVSVKAMPVLADHVIDRHAVLPMALVLEWAAEGALQRHPGLVVTGARDLRVFKGVILNGPAPLSIDVLAGKGARDGREWTVPVELRGAWHGGREILHARASIVLGERHAPPPAARRTSEPPALSRPARSVEEVYENLLFHGPALRGIQRIEGQGDRTIIGWSSPAPPPSEWLERPLRSRWLTDPLAIDCAFQLAVLWCRERLGANSLPTGIGRYEQYRASFGAGPVRIVVEVRHAAEAKALADIEFLDERGGPIAFIEGYECVVDRSLNQAFRRNQLAAASSVVAG